MKKMNKKGFTIVELVIVIAVIAILAAVMIPTFSGIVDKAKNSAALQEVKNAYTATITEELSTSDAADDKISEKTTAFNVKAGTGKIVKITAKGEVKETTETNVDYTVENGLIVCVNHDWSNNGTTCTCSGCSAKHSLTDADSDSKCDTCKVDKATNN